GPDDLSDLKSAVNDATKQQEAWKAQEGKLYAKAVIDPKLNKDGRRESLIAALEAIAKTAEPDDQLLVLLAGHGDFVVGAKGPESSTFVFCGPDYDRAK